MDSSSIKETVMRQIQLESNTSNARILIELTQPQENERYLLREVPSQTRIIRFERRADMLHVVHGGLAVYFTQFHVLMDTTHLQKYINAWSRVNASYIQRIRQEQSSL
ncbi:hypothetical protein diail_1153 [Diaporthe ilicicola]|nr:hypothetical protein diail_1153 [Diaporthe ilicicola]